MASERYYGKIGYGLSVQTSPGVTEKQVKEISYYGDLLTNYIRHDSTNNLNDDINISNRLSLLADPYAFSHSQNILYAVVDGEKWKVTGVERARPRLILTLGGVYNGDR